MDFSSLAWEGDICLLPLDQLAAIIWSLLVILGNNISSFPVNREPTTMSSMKPDQSTMSSETSDESLEEEVAFSCQRQKLYFVFWHVRHFQHSPRKESLTLRLLSFHSNCYRMLQRDLRKVTGKKKGCWKNRAYSYISFKNDREIWQCSKRIWFEAMQTLRVFF